MKQGKMIRLTVWLLLVAALLGMTACGDYRSDVASQTLVDALIEELAEEEYQYYTASGDTYAVYFEGEEGYSSLEDCCVAYHVNSTNVDQFGVFRVKKGGNVEKVRDMVQMYVDGQVEYLSSFAANYNQDELAKIENAAVEVVGQYVCFTILTAQDGDDAISTIREQVTR